MGLALAERGENESIGVVAIAGFIILWDSKRMEGGNGSSLLVIEVCYLVRGPTSDYGRAFSRNIRSKT